MTRITKALVLAGAAAMVASPLAAGAAGNSLPILAQGVGESGEESAELDGLLIGGVALGAVVIGLLVAGGSKSN